MQDFLDANLGLGFGFNILLSTYEFVANCNNSIGLYFVFVPFKPTLTMSLLSSTHLHGYEREN
jgi:hypothetical protein